MYSKGSFNYYVHTTAGEVGRGDGDPSKCESMRSGGEEKSCQCESLHVSFFS